VVEQGLHVAAEGFESRSTLVQFFGWAALSWCLDSGDQGAMTLSRTVSSAAMVRAAASGM